MNCTVYSASKKTLPDLQNNPSEHFNIKTKIKSLLSFWRRNERTNRMKRTELFKAKNVQMLHSFWEREKTPQPSTSAPV